MESIYYCCKCPLVFLSSPLLTECLYCPCNYQCSQDTVWNIEGQLQCMEWMNGFSEEYPCFGTTCGILMVNYLLMECHGVPWESEDCSVYVTCCVASCGLGVDAIICPLYCSYCICNTCYNAPQQCRRGKAKNEHMLTDDTGMQSPSLMTIPGESIHIRDHYISELERGPPALSTGSSANEPQLSLGEPTDCIPNELHATSAQDCQDLPTRQETAREQENGERSTEDQVGGVPASHNDD